MLPFQTLVCAVDLTPGSAPALRAAAGLAARTGAALHVVHVVPPYQAAQEGRATGASLVQAFVDATLGAGAALAPERTMHGVVGLSPAAAVVRTVEAVGGDAVVVGTHGRRGLEHVLLGSVAAGVLRHAPVPILVVPEHAGPLDARPVLMAADVTAQDAASDRARLRLAHAWAVAHGAPLVLGHVRPVSPDTLAEAALRPVLRGQAASNGLSREAAHAALDHLAAEADAGTPEQHVVPGVPGPDLVALAGRLRASVVVMGTHGRSGLARVRLGSVAEWVVRHAPCAVLVVPLDAP